MIPSEATTRFEVSKHIKKPCRKEVSESLIIVCIHFAYIPILHLLSRSVVKGGYAVHFTLDINVAHNSGWVEQFYLFRLVYFLYTVAA